ncbi:transglycosylase domain-containing protein [Paenibacillus sp. YYML68]|uniref:transglycosylase domain-containing protein n=1 Tax=Paenibacillus sp. YYML68 TaxID=2909250 RepID=UPI00248F516B|nr:PBP1A family penicillin-binding protein [Paenibacillus sp. YYML68]
MTGTGRKAANPTPKAKKSAGGGKKRKKIGAGKIILSMFITAMLAAICAMGVYIFVIINGDRILQQNINKLEFDEASHIYDITGQEAGVLKVENRINVTAAEIPELVRDAFIATEDKRFNQHTGVDLFGIARALVKDIVARSMVEGGSTITQQLAKNVFLSADKTFFRKATEMSIAMALERQYPKEEILEYYLNRIYFGNRAYGIKAAAKTYFGKSKLEELDIWEAATLAAMPKAPNTYNPISNPEKSKERRAVVLRLMTDQGYISESQRADAAAREYVQPTNTGKDQFQAYIDYVLREAQEKYGYEEDDLLRNGYSIYTNLDPNAQRVMEQTFANPAFFQKDGPAQKMQGSMVILNNKDGGIVAMVGGRDYVARGLNRSVAQPRQPGSSFKPLISFAPALEEGKYTPYSKLPDEKRSFNGYTPSNWDGVYRGEVSMFEAVKHSANIPAVEVLSKVGVKTAKSYVERLGIPFHKDDNNLALALGGMTTGVTTLQMAQAYTAFPNNGYVQEAHAITRIEGKDGAKTAYKPEKKARVWSAKTAWQMTQLMLGVVEPGGTGAAAKFERPVAGKTGSTQLDIKGLEKHNRDLWFVGYTPEWTAAVWMGFDKTDSKHYISMSSGSAAKIFKEVMQKSLVKRPVTQFQKPEGVPDLNEAPKSIGDLKAEYSAESSLVLLTWSGVGDNVQYQLFRKDSTMTEFPKEPLTSTAQTEVKDRTAVQAGTYEYVVVPVNTENNVAGERSNVAQIVVADATKPSQGEGAGGEGTEDEEGRKPGEGGERNGDGTTNVPNEGTPRPGGTIGTGGSGITPGAGQGTGAGNGIGTGTGTGTSPKPGTGTGAGTGTSKPGTGTGSGAGTGSGTGSGADTGSSPRPGSGSSGSGGTSTSGSGASGGSTSGTGATDGSAGASGSTTNTGSRAGSAGTGAGAAQPAAGGVGASGAPASSGTGTGSSSGLSIPTSP